MACLRNTENVVLESRLGDLNHSHSRNLNGLCYLAWPESWCHDFAASLLVLKVCCFRCHCCLALVHPFSLGELPFLQTSLCGLTLLSAKEHIFQDTCLLFLIPAPPWALAVDRGKQQALMSETKALKKLSFQKSSRERGEARRWIVKVRERPLDKGFGSLYSASSWLRTSHSSSKAFPRRWAISITFLEQNTKGHTFLKGVFLGLQGLENVFSWTDESSFHDVINLMAKLWLRIRFLPRVLLLHSWFSMCCGCWAIWNKSVFGFLCGRETLMLLWSTIQATNPFLQDSFEQFVLGFADDGTCKSRRG